MSERVETIKAMYGKVDVIMKEIIKRIDTLEKDELKELTTWLTTNVIGIPKEVKDNDEN